MPSIGGYSVLRIDGPFKMAQLQVGDIVRPGTDGIDFVDLGIRGEPYKVRTLVDVSGGSGVSNAMIALNDLVGNLVTVVDNSGRTWTNIMVKECEHVRVRPAAGGVGGINGGDRLLETEFVLRSAALWYGG